MVGCRLCGSAKTAVRYTIDAWSVIECKACGFGFIYPFESSEKIHTIYKNEYFASSGKKGYEDYSENAALRVETFSYYFKQIIPFLVDKKATLDIGCADGSFLKITQNAGFITNEGVELNQEMFERVSKDFTVYNSPLETITTEKNYDLLTLFDVIEHIPDLESAGRKLRLLSKPGSLLVILTPDYNSIGRKTKGKKWFQFKPPEHINYFSASNLETFLKQYGFKTISVQKGYSMVDYNFISHRLKKYGYSFFYRIFKIAGPLLFIRRKHIKISNSSIFLIAQRVD